MKKERKIRVSTAAVSDIGRVRKANEDSFYISKNENLLIVCDGMGGQIAGGLASKIAVETVKDVFFGFSKDQVKQLFHDLDTRLALSTLKLIAGVRLANRRIYMQSLRFPKLRGMGTTVVALTFDQQMATMVHVGDSRIFRISEGNVLQLTEDHSWLNELIEDNEINEEQIETFTQKNVITRALGTSPTVKVDIHTEKYNRGDIYLLSTDGFHNSVNGEEIKSLLREKKESLAVATRRLVEQAKTRDGTDNITVALARIHESSRDTSLGGISTTVQEEDEKIQNKEDRFIHYQYIEPKAKTLSGNLMLASGQQRMILIGSVIATALICFLLGMGLQSKKQNSVANRRATTAGISPTGTAATPERVVMGSSQQQTTNGRETDAVAEIRKSGLADDAVLAVVFFNSRRDFNNARLKERGLVLDQLMPYSTEGVRIQGDFSIFLIDSSNNVIHKTTGLTLPDLGAK